MFMKAIMRLLLKLTISCVVLTYAIVQSYGTIVGVCGLVVDYVRYWIKVYIMLVVRVREYYAFGCRVLMIFRRPLAEEYRRFISVFRPEPVVWYNWSCLRRFFSRSIVNDLSGSKHSSYFLDELSMFANHPLYVRQSCVLYKSWFDVVVLLSITACVLFLLHVLVRAVLTRLHFFDPIGRVHSSKFITWMQSLTVQPLYHVATIRKMFSNTELVKLKLPTNHTHPNSAAVRTQSVTTIELICGVLGVEPYFVQMSSSDVKNQRVGSRSFYWGKDVGVAAAEFNPPRDSVIVMIDVDMYIDMHFLLANHVHTYMISTFQPTVAACDKGEFSFTFDENDTVKYTVSGGAVYEHPVWNYSGDILTVSARVWGGLGVRTTIYNIDRKQSDDHHQIVCLTPMSTFICPLFDISYLLSSPKLARLRVACEGFLRLKVKKNDCTMVSTAVVGRYAAATVSITDDDTLAGHAKLGKTDITVAGVRQVLPEIGAEAASVLVQFHRRGLEYDADTVFPISSSVNNYQFDPVSYDPEASLGVVPFMNPLVLGCFAPVKSKSNDQATIQGRVLDVKPSDNIEITQFDLTLMKEFCEFLVPEHLVGTGIPLGVEEVYERQNRPTQRRILDAGAMSYNLLSTENIDCFQKAESYGDVKDPRNISTVPGTTKLNYSMFMYSFVDTVLKKMPWYAFAYTPIEIAARIVLICLTACFVYNTDLSRFDGRVSKYLRTLESMYMQRWVHRDYAAELAELCASQHSQRAKTRFGIKFWTGFSRLSGSPETSSFNSIDNAFMAYKAFRMTRINGEFMTPVMAWGKLGIYGGDDGLSADVDPVSYVKSCASVGQKLEIIEIARGQPGVSFLSRLFSPAVWYGSMNSMCDVARQLTKLHTTTSLPPDVTPMQKLHEKMTGFYVSDSNTPIIGEYAKLVIDKFGMAEMGLGVANYFAKHPVNEQFPNSDDDDWMISEVEKQLPLFDFGLFGSWLDKVKIGAASILQPPLCVPNPTHVPVVKRAVVINGDVISPLVTLVEKLPSVDGVLEKLSVVDHVPDVPIPLIEVDDSGVQIEPRTYACPHMKTCTYGLKCFHLSTTSPCRGPLCEYEHGVALCKYGVDCKNIEKCSYTHRVGVTPKTERKEFAVGKCRKDLECKFEGCKYLHSAPMARQVSGSTSTESLPKGAASIPSSVGSGVRA